MDNLSLLIIGYDKDSDIFPYFSLFYGKYCSSIQEKAFFASSKEGISCHGVVNCFAKDDQTFSGRVLAGLNSIKSDYVLLLLHDYWFYDSPNDKTLGEYCAFMDKKVLIFFNWKRLLKASIFLKKFLFAHEGRI
jgi:hypothetical protein